MVTENDVTTIYSYILHGKLITHLTKGSVDAYGNESYDHLHFFYDAQSKPAFVEYNSEMYRYIHNLQGDIVGIVDANGTLVVEYKYDAWGNHISTVPEHGVGAINPFRYRGYINDVETGLYYLQSRYYSPRDSRFINIDNVIGKPGVVLSHTLYCYCNNNAVMFTDHLGQTGQSIYYWGNANENCYSVELTIYVPEQEDIDNFVIGHFEISLKYNDVWRTYSFGPQSASDIINGAPDSPGIITVRSDRGKWKSAYPCNVYCIRADFPNSNIEYGISLIRKMVGESENKKGHLEVKKYTVKSGPFKTYSLNKDIGKVCRDFAAYILYAIGVFVLDKVKGYYPKAFVDEYLNQK